MIRLTDDTITTDEALAAVASRGCGGTAVFIGTVRDDPDAHPNGGLHYEAYVTMAREKLERLEADIVGEYAGSRVAILHRLGDVPVGEASIVIAVATPHRTEAFEACRKAIETVKRDIPIWKIGGSCCHAKPSPGSGGDK